MIMLASGLLGLAHPLASPTALVAAQAASPTSGTARPRVPAKLPAAANCPPAMIDEASARPCDWLALYLAYTGLGNVRPYDPAQALHWLRKAAYKRDARAMTALAVAYWNGEAGPQSRSRALEWLQKAVDQKEDPEAMRTLAGIYRTDHKYGDALHLYGKAVRSGSVDARVDAGVMYEEGQGIDRDLDEASCF